MTPKKQVVKLTPGEAELLDIFWRHGPLSLSRVHEIYGKGTGRPALQTIQTRLKRMVGKGLLHRSDDFPAVYSYAVTREQAKDKYFDLLGELAGNDLAPLMLHMAEKRTLSDAEVAAMEEILARHRQRKRKSKEADND